MTATDPFDQLLTLEKRGLDRAQASLSDADLTPVIQGKLALRLGRWYLMFSLTEVDEIIRVPQITPVPGVKPWLLGIGNLRGTILSIIDLQMMLSNATPTELTANSRTVVFHAGEWSYGLLVDEVIGMRHFSSEHEITSLDDIDPGIRSFLTGTFHGENRTWWVFSIDRLRQSKKFLQALG
jgi:twitching motility protein PilI